MFLDVLRDNFATFVVFWVLFVLTWMFLKTKRPRDIPPGPTPLPFVGNVLNLKGDRRKAFKRLRGRYGDVFSLFTGDQLVVVVNGYEALKEAFIKNSDAFSDRPAPETQFFFPEWLRTPQGVLRASGEMWRKNRRFALSTLRDFGMGKNTLQIAIQEEATHLTQAIENLNGKPFDLSRFLHNAVSNIICSIVFGKRFEYDDEKFQHYLDVMSKLVSCLGNNVRLVRVPLLRHLPGDITGLKRIIGYFTEVTKFITASIEKHLQDYDENNINSLIDAYIKQEKLNNKQYSREDIYAWELTRIVFDLFLAGTETTATSIRWAILYYLNYPNIQDKVWDQVSNAVSSDRSPGVEDRKQMPYLEATIMEILRHANIVPLSAVHGVSHDTKLRGYLIPKGAFAVVNLDSVMTDPNLWTDPDRFDPERFLDSEALKKFEHFIPFSLGKRVCLGESLARMELTIFLAVLTKHFEFLPPEGEGPPPLEGKLGGTFAPNTYLVRAVKRTTQ